MISTRLRVLILVLSFFLLYTGQSQQTVMDSIASLAQNTPERYILKGVKIINPLKSTTSNRRTVVIEGNRVALIKGNWRSMFMKGVKVDCKDKFISPGLMDAHVHLHCDYQDRISFVRYGVTNVMGFTPGPDELENSVADSLHLPFPVIYGEGCMNLGYEHTPKYHWPTQEVGLPFALITQGDQSELYTSVEQINFNHQVISPKIERTTAFHTFLLGKYLNKCRDLDYGYFRRFITPTALALHEKAAREEMVDYTNSISAMLYSDYKILFGSDVRNGYYQNDNTLFSEIDLHKPLNLRPDQILKGLCVTPYKFLNSTIPQVQEGSRANLVIYEQNPLVQINTLKSPWMVIMRGVKMDKELLKWIDKTTSVQKSTIGPNLTAVLPKRECEMVVPPFIEDTAAETSDTIIPLSDSGNSNRDSTNISVSTEATVNSLVDSNENIPMDITGLKPIEFGFDKSELTAEALGELKKWIEAIQKRPVDTIKISGHADSTGNYTYNVKLSERRALAVENHLKKNGIKIPIVVVYHGFRSPRVSNDTKVGRARNRRVDIRLIEHHKVESH